MKSEDFSLALALDGMGPLCCHGKARGVVGWQAGLCAPRKLGPGSFLVFLEGLASSLSGVMGAGGLDCRDCGGGTGRKSSSRGPCPCGHVGWPRTTKKGLDQGG